MPTYSKRHVVHGAIFSHRSVERATDLKAIIGSIFKDAQIGQHTYSRLTSSEAQDFEIDLFFDNRNDSINRSEKRHFLRFSIFQVNTEKYPLLQSATRSETPIFWINTETESDLGRFFDALKLAYPSSERKLTFYGVRLGDFLHRIIWEQDHYKATQGGYVHPRISQIEVSLGDDEGNADRVAFSSGQAHGLIEKGIISIVQNLYVVRVRGLLVALDEKAKGTKILIDGSGNFKLRPYKSTSSLEPVSRLLHRIANDGLLVRQSSWNSGQDALMIRIPES